MKKKSDCVYVHNSDFFNRKQKTPPFLGGVFYAEETIGYAAVFFTMGV